MNAKQQREAEKRFTDEWKRAVAANNAAKRNRRGRRPKPAIIGVVIMPKEEKL
jgi:hypothetical protein